MERIIEDLMKTLINRPIWMGVLALFAMGFGLLTLISGGSVLFNSQARQAAGNSVDFVVWFNFLAGFAYIIAGVGLWRLQGWSVWLSFLIAGATMLVFALFGVYVFSGGAYEIRTVAAMALRTAVWLVISVVAYRTIQLGLAKGI
jgi:hypothetical protein